MTARAIVYTDDDLRRPAGWDRLNAWHECEVAPCGEPGQLQWHHCAGEGIYTGREGGRPDLSDCLAVQPPNRPWLLTVWEPLRTKAPGPHLATAFCCYINTVKFYARPYIVLPWSHLWRGAGGKLQASRPGFYEWDSVETRIIGGDDQLIYRGEIFDAGGGRVRASGDRFGRGWWMRHSLRRRQEDRR